MKSKKNIKISVIGVGHLGNFHARIFSEIDEVVFVGVFDVDKKRAQEIADKYNTKVYTDIDEIIKDSDAVSIVVPTEFHFEIAKKCILSGKDVFLEKPITETLEQADELIKLVKKNNVLLQVGHVEHFNSVVTTVKPLIKNPRFIEVDRLGPYSFRNIDIGVVKDLMIHDIDIILHLVKSDIENIHAIGINVLSGKDDIANARIVFKNGCVANVNASRISQKKLRKIRIFQEDSYLSIDYMKQKARLFKKKENAPLKSNSIADYIERKIIRIKKNRPLDEELKDFVCCVKNRIQPVVNAEYGRRALAVGVEILCQMKKYLS